MQLVADGRTEYNELYADSYFYIGDMMNPVAIMQYKDIPGYLDEAFWSQYQIWDRTRLTKSLPLSPVWGDNPEYLIDIITAFQDQYERIVRGR